MIAKHFAAVIHEHFFVSLVSYCCNGSGFNFFLRFYNVTSTFLFRDSSHCARKEKNMEGGGVCAENDQYGA